MEHAGAWAQLLMAAGFVLVAWPAVRRQWREDRAGLMQATKLVGLFILYALVGIAILVTLVPEGGDETKVIPGMGLVLSWMFLGALWLARLLPRTEALPSWVEQPWGTVDYALLTVLTGCLIWMRL